MLETNEKTKEKRMIKRLAVFASFLSVSALLVACGGDEVRQNQPVTPVPVKTALVSLQPTTLQTSYSGTAYPLERVRLSTKVMGWVEAIYFAEGAQFKKGDLLLKLQSKDLEAKRAQAEAAIAEADVHFQNVKTNYDRIAALFEKGAATQKELDDMSSALASARARKIQAEKMKVEADEILKYSNIAAPFDGTVGRKLIEIGDMANPGQPLLQIENSRRVKIIAKVPESDIHALSVGMPVWVEIQASAAGTNNDKLQGVIDKIVPAADPVSRQFDVQVLVDNPGGKIKSGMFARVLVARVGSSALLVPKQAIFRRGQLQGVFVVTARHQALLRWVQVGAEYDGSVEVLSGLNAGERVVIASERKLLDGQAVEVTE